MQDDDRTNQRQPHRGLITSSGLTKPIIQWNFSDNKAKFLNLYLEKKFNITAICAEVGVSRQAYYTWKEEDPDFVKALDDLRMYLVDRAEEVALHALDNGNPNVAMFILSKLHPAYRDKVDVTSNGETLGNVVFITVPPKDDD